MPNFHHGGAESVMVEVANYLTLSGISVIFVVVQAEGVLLKDLDSRIKIVNLNLRSQWLAPFLLPWSIRRYTPDYVFSTMKESNFIAILSRVLAFSKAQNIIREANTVSREIANENKWYQKAKNKIIFKFYRWAEQVVVLSDSIKQDLLKVAPVLNSEKITVIPNTVNLEKIKKMSQEELPDAEIALIKNRPLLLAVGRLYPQKNYFFLFEALTEYRKRGNKFTFFALGEGPLRLQLEKQIIERGLSDCCYLLGYRENPYKYMEKADVFLLPSLYEGMSNSLVQAMGLNMKVLVADSQDTSKELLELYGSGLLYAQGDIDSFCDSLVSVVEINKESSGLNDYLQGGMVKYKQLFEKL